MFGISEKMWSAVRSLIQGSNGDKRANGTDKQAPKTNDFGSAQNRPIVKIGRLIPNLEIKLLFAVEPVIAWKAAYFFDNCAPAGEFFEG